MNHATLAIMMLGSLLAAITQTTLAQGTIYTSRALFEQQLSSSTTITMESLPAATDAELVGGQGKTNITVAGVSFESSSTTLYVSNPNRLAYPIPGDGQYIFNFDSFSPVNILLPGGVTAFGADFSGGIFPNPTYNAILTVNLVGGGAYEYSFLGTRGSWTFFGVTFPEPIANLTYSDYSGLPAALHEEKLDNVTFGSAIPEPSIFALFALGGLLLGWRCRRSKC